jgi:hypothetical protein
MDSENKITLSFIRKINIFIQKILLGHENIEFSNQTLVEKIESDILMMGQKSNYYKYFFSTENQEKENLYLFHKGVMEKYKKYLIFSFFSFEITKRILWNRGYFSHFFFHTRLMGVATFFIIWHLINKNFEANLIADQLYDYKNKFNRREYILNKISQDYLKEYLINKKKEEEIDF